MTRILRLAVLFVVSMFLQWWWSAHLSLWGLAPQILLVLTVCVAARLGAVAGMCYGFAWGLFLDVMRAQLFGANALALVLVGYGTGSARRQLDVVSLASQAMVVFLMTWAYFLVTGRCGLVFMRTFLWVGWQAFLFDPLYNCALVPFVALFWEALVGKP